MDSSQVIPPPPPGFTLIPPPPPGFTLIGDTPTAPQAAQTPNILERFNSRLPTAGITEVPGAISDIASSGVLNALKAMGTGIAETVVTPFLPSTAANQYEALRARGQSVPYSALGSIPLVGPAADVVTQDIYQGKGPEIAGDLVTLGLGAGATSKAKILQTPVGTAAREVATHPATVGLGTLAATGSPLTAAGAAATVALLKRAGNTEALSYMAAAPGKIGIIGKILQKIVKAPEAEQVKMIRGLPEEEFQLLQDHLAAIAHNDALDTAVQNQRDAFALDHLKQARAQTLAEIAREEATAKLAERDTIAAAKTEASLLDKSTANEARTIAKTEKEAAKATETGTKLDQEIAQKKLAQEAAQAKELLKRQGEREAASIQSAKAEVKILEDAQKAEAAAQSELQAANAAVEKAGAREMAQALKTQAAATEKAAKATEATRKAQERADKAQISREFRQRRQLDEQAKREAAKAAKETPAPEAAPTPTAPAEPTVVTQLKAMKPAEGAAPATKPGAELKAALDESTPKPQLDAPEDVAKFTRAVQGILHSVPRAKNGPRAAYGIADLEAAPALQKGHAGVSPEMKAKIIQTTVRVGADAERVANGLASQGMTAREIVSHLKDTQGMPTNAALDFAEPAIIALGKRATPAQRASVKAIANRNNKKLKLEDLSD